MDHCLSYNLGASAACLLGKMIGISPSCYLEYVQRRKPLIWLFMMDGVDVLSLPLEGSAAHYFDNGRAFHTVKRESYCCAQLEILEQHTWKEPLILTVGVSTLDGV
ncbi:unnamed protein product [Trifolium pratense]|uniref:Uncharacterized protein n=1 Tax=Trifolium pratense TaxID=57577 RepID=A0ACB0K0N3_TRIPR|nr:unnamed protein product [Trifolium pratense]